MEVDKFFARPWWKHILRLPEFASCQIAHQGLLDPRGLELSSCHAQNTHVDTGIRTHEWEPSLISLIPLTSLWFHRRVLFASLLSFDILPYFPFIAPCVLRSPTNNFERIHRPFLVLVHKNGLAFYCIFHSWSRRCGLVRFVFRFFWAHSFDSFTIKWADNTAWNNALEKRLWPFREKWTNYSELEYARNVWLSFNVLFILSVLFSHRNGNQGRRRH